MPKPSDFANANIDEVVEALSQDEAISLTAGVGFWHTAAIPRLNVPAIKVSDGPNGVRGNHFFRSTPAKVIPCATALGSTFDPKLIGQVGSKLLASEAKLRGASIILAPTVNIQRSPLGGRSFEAFSEDPFLSGTIASAYISGLQNEGIGACIKHYVANDQEDDRQGVDSKVSPRALREVYLMPFMIAEKLAKPWCYMTAYNKLNGLHCSENPFLIQGVLRGEWKSDAAVMSDWFGVYSVTDSINAGLDLEMPGVNKWRSDWQMNWSLNGRKTTLKTIKERAKNVLKLVKKASKGAPDVLDGDGVERTNDSEEDKVLLRSLAAQTIVLLKNQDNILPLAPDSLKKVAIIGGNAKAPVPSGGGSASLKPSYFVNPYDGIVAGLKENTKVLYAEGAQAFMTLPSLDYDIINSKGGKGFDAAFYSHDANNQPCPEPIQELEVDETYIFISNSAPEGITERWTLKLKGFMKPREEDTLFEFGLTVAGRAKLYVDGKLLIDNWTLQRRGVSFFMTGTEEEKGRFLLKKGVSHEILIEFGNVRGPSADDPDEKLIGGGPGVRLGGAIVMDPQAEIERAVELAKEADVAIVVVGLNGDWETEGYDRKSLKLPGTTDELVRRVGQANPRTVVVTQSGSAVEMPWVEDVAAIAHSWFLGNATGEAISDVLFGKINPSSKLSITFPKRLEDTPSYGHFGSENGTVWYAEDLFVGYKHYVRTGTSSLFAFGHGLSYTTFTFSDLTVSSPTGPELSFTAKVKVTNSGSRSGSEVVQIYVTPSSTSKLTHPVRALKGYAKTKELAAGESTTVEIALDKYALSYWCAVENHWTIEKGKYGVIVGAGAEDVQLTAEVEVDKETYWSGL